MPRQVASLYGVLALDDRQFRSGMNEARTGMQGLGSTLQNVGGRISATGQQLTQAMAPMGVLLGVAVNSANDFNRSMSNVNSVLQLSTEDAAALSQELLAFGATTVAGPQRTVEAYYDIVGAVADTSTHMAILHAATATAEAGQADLGVTVSALTGVMNSYRFGADDASFASDVLSRTVMMGVGSMEQLAGAFPRVATLGAAMGQPIEDLGVAMAYLSTKNNDFSLSATNMTAMMTTLLNPTGDLQTAITALGYESGQALLESQGLVGAYQLLSQQNGGLAGLVTNQEALMGAIALTDAGFTDFSANYIAGINGATDAMGAIQDKTEGWAKFNSALGALGIIVGNTLIPVLSDLLTNHITPMLKAAGEWVTQNPELAGTIMQVVAAAVVLGPTIMMVGGILSGLGTIIGVVTTALTVLWTVGLGPVGFALAAAGLLVAAYMNNWMGFKTFVDTQIMPMLNTLRYGLQPVIDQTQLAVNSLLSFVGLGGAPASGSGIGVSAGMNRNSGGGGGVSAGMDRDTSGGGVSAGTLRRAYGGAVSSNTPYTVGERGAETFVPHTSGQIIPAGGGGGSSDTYNVTINAGGGADGRAIARDFNSEMQSIRRRRG